MRQCVQGGWWTRPSNWAANTAIAAVGIIAATYGVWRVSASLEVCLIQPSSTLQRSLSVPFLSEKNGTTQSTDTFNAGMFILAFCVAIFVVNVFSCSVGEGVHRC